MNPEKLKAVGPLKSSSKDSAKKIFLSSLLVSAPVVMGDGNINNKGTADNFRDRTENHDQGDPVSKLPPYPLVYKRENYIDELTDNPTNEGDDEAPNNGTETADVELPTFLPEDIEIGLRVQPTIENELGGPKPSELEETPNKLNINIIRQSLDSLAVPIIEILSQEKGVFSLEGNMAGIAYHKFKKYRSKVGESLADYERNKNKNDRYLQILLKDFKGKSTSPFIEDEKLVGAQINMVLILDILYENGTLKDICNLSKDGGIYNVAGSLAKAATSDDLYSQLEKVKRESNQHYSTEASDKQKVSFEKIAGRTLSKDELVQIDILFTLLEKTEGFRNMFEYLMNNSVEKIKSEAQGEKRKLDKKEKLGRKILNMVTSGSLVEYAKKLVEELAKY